MNQLDEIKDRLTDGLIDDPIYFDDMKWLITHLEQAIEIAETIVRHGNNEGFIYDNLDKARQFLEKVKK